MNRQGQRGADTGMLELIEQRLSDGSDGRAVPQVPAKEAIGALLRHHPRRDGESMDEWIHRVCDPAAAADVVPLSAQPRATEGGPSIRWLSECVRMAADSGGLNALPEGLLVSTDGQFEIETSREGGKVRLGIRAVGFAAVDLAQAQVALAAHREDEQPLALITLNDEGEGECTLPDDAETRRALVRLVVGVIEPG